MRTRFLSSIPFFQVGMRWDAAGFFDGFMISVSPGAGVVERSPGEVGSCTPAGAGCRSGSFVRVPSGLSRFYVLPPFIPQATWEGKGGQRSRG